jgi:hypothetical protein
MGSVRTAEVKEYRKIATIKAAQFFPDTKPWPEGVVESSDSPTGYGIHGLENTVIIHEVTPGDWIATGAKGEHYAIKDKIFKETYEPVESENL